MLCSLVCPLKPKMVCDLPVNASSAEEKTDGSHQQRDDERYPIPVQSYPDGEIPQVASNPRQEHYGDPQDKFIAPNEAGEIQNGGIKVDAVAGAEPRRATLCGLRRRTFWIVAAIVVIGAIAALVGGLVGGLKARERSRGGDSDSSSGTSSTSPPFPSPTGPLNPAKRAIAAATTSGSKKSTLQVFYQDLDTTDIFYRLVWEDKAKAEHRVSLKMTPNQGTPLAVTASNTTDNRGIDVNLFYLSVQNATDLVIVQAALECSLGAATCSTVSNQVISSSFANGISPASGLSAVLLNNERSRFRVYFQAPKGLIWTMVGDDPSEHGWSPQQIAGPAADGSSIAASLGDKDGAIMVAFVFNDNGMLRAVEYTDSIGGGGGE